MTKLAEAIGLETLLWFHQDSANGKTWDKSVFQSFLGHMTFHSQLYLWLWVRYPQTCDIVKVLQNNFKKYYLSSLPKFPTLNYGIALAFPCLLAVSDHWLSYNAQIIVPCQSVTLAHSIILLDTSLVQWLYLKHHSEFTRVKVGWDFQTAASKIKRGTPIKLTLR